MDDLSRQPTNNAAVMLESSATSTTGSSSVASPMVSMAPVTMSPSVVMTAQDLSQAFSHMLSKSLLQILVAMQNQTSQLKVSNVTASGSVPLSTCLSSFPMNSSPRFAAGLSAGNIIVPSFVPTYCTIRHSFLSHPSLLGSHGASSECFPSPANFSLQHFPHHLGSHSCFFVAQASCHWPRIFTHP